MKEKNHIESLREKISKVPNNSLIGLDKYFPDLTISPESFFDHLLTFKHAEQRLLRYFEIEESDNFQSELNELFSYLVESYLKYRKLRSEISEIIWLNAWWKISDFNIFPFLVQDLIELKDKNQEILIDFYKEIPEDFIHTFEEHTGIYFFSRKYMSDYTKHSCPKLWIKNGEIVFASIIDLYLSDIDIETEEFAKFVNYIISIGDKEALEKIISKEPNLQDYYTKYKIHLLRTAITNKKNDLIPILIKAGVSADDYIEISESLEINSLGICILLDNLKALIEILDNVEIDINNTEALRKGNLNLNALFLSVELKKIDIFKLLIDKYHAKIDYVSPLGINILDQIFNLNEAEVFQKFFDKALSCLGYNHTLLNQFIIECIIEKRFQNEEEKFKLVCIQQTRLKIFQLYKDSDQIPEDLLKSALNLAISGNDQKLLDKFVLTIKTKPIGEQRKHFLDSLTRGNVLQSNLSSIMRFGDRKDILEKILDSTQCININEDIIYRQDIKSYNMLSFSLIQRKFDIFELLIDKYHAKIDYSTENGLVEILKVLFYIAKINTEELFNQFFEKIISKTGYDHDLVIKFAIKIKCQFKEKDIDSCGIKRAERLTAKIYEIFKNKDLSDQNDLASALSIAMIFKDQELILMNKVLNHEKIYTLLLSYDLSSLIILTAIRAQDLKTLDWLIDSGVKIKEIKAGELLKELLNLSEDRREIEKIADKFLEKLEVGSSAIRLFVTGLLETADLGSISYLVKKNLISQDAFEIANQALMVTIYENNQEAKKLLKKLFDYGVIKDTHNLSERLSISFNDHSKFYQKFIGRDILFSDLSEEQISFCEKIIEIHDSYKKGRTIEKSSPKEIEQLEKLCSLLANKLTDNNIKESKLNVQSLSRILDDDKERKFSKHTDEESIILPLDIAKKIMLEILEIPNEMLENSNIISGFCHSNKFFDEIIEGTFYNNFT